MSKTGYLVLENGMTFEGKSFGHETDVAGEVVFNTGMVGYPESFTDPSYAGQIVTMTYPLIGNYGVPKEEVDSVGIPSLFESDRIHICGLIVSSYIESTAHWQAEMTLSEWLKRQRVPAIEGIDTRTLTQILREDGVLKGMILKNHPPQRRIFFRDPNKENLVAGVSVTSPIEYPGKSPRIMFIDCGAKVHQLRILRKLGATVIRVPWNFNPFNEGESQSTLSGKKSVGKGELLFDAIIISNGPGDPKMAKETVETVRQAMEHNIPILGICLGNQILALAAGANTYKLRYGHRGQNQPVKEEGTTRCFVTTQNHGFSVDAKTLPAGWEQWFVNLNDNTNEGIRHKNKLWMSVQFHPESTPGPTDTEWIFKYFLDTVKKGKK